MALRPSSVPLRVPLPSPPTSSLPDVPDPESDLARAASTVLRLLAIVVTDPLLESAAASALVAELVDFAVTCRQLQLLHLQREDFECLSAVGPHLMAMLLAPEGDPDAPDIPTPRSYAEAITGPYSSQWQTAMDAEMASWKSTGTYVDAVPPYGVNIVNGMWIFRVKRPPDSPPVFKDYVGRDFSQRQGVDPSLFLRIDTSLPPFYVLLYVDDLVVSFAYTEALALVKSKLQKRHTCTDLGELRSYLGSQITWDRARRIITLTQSHMVHQVLQHFGFWYFSPQSTPLPTGHLLSAPLSDESVEPSGPSYAGSPTCYQRPRSSPVLYVDNKAMIALCQEHRLEHRTKHIALRFFLAQELQQRGQLRLAYVTIRANIYDIFTKALQSARAYLAMAPNSAYFLNMESEHLRSWPVGPTFASAALLSVARPVARDAAFFLPAARLLVALPWGQRDALPVVRPVARDGALPVAAPPGARTAPNPVACRGDPGGGPRVGPSCLRAPSLPLPSPAFLPLSHPF
ncbi:unnamed protein product [Closterium sp. NIES-54]